MYQKAGEKMNFDKKISWVILILAVLNLIFNISINEFDYHDGASASWSFQTIRGAFSGMFLINFALSLLVIGYEIKNLEIL